MIIMPEQLQELMDELKISSAETYYHSIHVKSYTYKLIKAMNTSGYASFTPEEIEFICKGSLIHDIGKLFIKNKILTKSSNLNDDEMDSMIEHTKLGYEAVSKYLTKEEQNIIENICLYHHERIDGSGYNKIKDIPLYVQIVSICDVFDALTTDRVYREAIDLKTAIGMIENGECGLFDSNIIKYLKGIVE